MPDEPPTPDAPVTDAEQAIDEPTLVDAATVARLLSISASSFWKLNAEGVVPAPLRFGRITRWNKEELRCWVNSGCPSRFRWELLRALRRWS